MKRLLISFVLVFVGLFTVYYFSKIESDTYGELTLEMNKYYEDQILDNKIRNMVNNASSLAELKDAESKMVVLSAKDRERLAPTVTLKMANFTFEEAEGYLKRAIEIEQAATLPLHHKKELHPLAAVNLNKAVELYDRARVLCENLKDTGDVDFDFHMNYLKGEIYYRLLEFVADKESAPEMFNQSLTYYKYALRNRNNDINTVVNIELLIKNQKDLTGSADGPQARKKQMLNSKKYGVGKSSGN